MHARDNYPEFMPPIVEYAIDSAPHTPIVLAGKVIDEITPDRFVKDLYIKWPEGDFEEVLFRRLLTSTQLTCLAAYRGCGKTSAVWYSVKRLEAEYKGRVQPVVLDIKHLYDNGMFSPLSDKPTEDLLGHAYHIFKTEIRKVVQLKLLPGPANTLKLLAWVLAGPPDTTDIFEDLLVAAFVDLSDRAIIAARAMTKNRRDRKAAIEHFLATDQRVSDFHEAAMLHVTTAHVVRAAMAKHGWQRVVLVFDNIDRIPMAYQLKFMEAVNDTHNALGGVCGTVVAVRRETLRRQAARPNSKGDPIDIIAPSSAEYPPILFPDTKPEHVRRILQCRHDYSINLYDKYTRDAAAEVASAIGLHNRVVIEFVEDSIHALANGSIRALEQIYTGFFRYIHEVESNNLARGLDIRTDERHLQTLFFLFLRENAREYGLIYYEIVRPEADIRSAADVPDLASIHHLILTALLNLTNELQATASGVHHPTFKQLTERLATLGFDIDTIRGAILEMHAEPGEPPRTLELIDVDPSMDNLHANATLRMRLTPLGYVLVTSLLHKVGYVWGHAHDNYIRGLGKRTFVRSYYDLDSNDRVRIFFSYLSELAANHLKLLSLVQKRLAPRHDHGWLHMYRSRFGVESQFQVQRLCASAASFYQPHFVREHVNPFIGLRRAYNDLLGDMLHGTSYDKLEMARLPAEIERHCWRT
jgi:hypothetical protein